VWYDLQTPKSTVFWVAGVELATGHRTWYHLERNEWSVHYNVSADGKLFAGDGGGPSSVAGAVARQRDPQTAGQRPVDLPIPARSMVKGSSFATRGPHRHRYFKSEASW